METALESRLRSIPLAHITADPDQPRRIFRTEEMAQLVGSMRDGGLLQPIIVRPVASGRFIIIAGERRFRAATELAWKSIDAIVRADLAPTDVLAAQVVENIGRQAMTPIEEGRAYRRLLDSGWTEEQVQQRLGLPNWQVGWRLDLLKLIPQLQALVECDGIKPRIARYLTKLSDVGQARAFARLNSEEMNDGQVAAMVEALYAEECGRDMFPGLARVSPETRNTLDRLQRQIEAATVAVRAAAALSDAELASALAADLPALITRSAELRSQVDRLHRRLVKIQSATAMAVAS